MAGFASTADRRDQQFMGKGFAHMAGQSWPTMIAVTGDAVGRDQLSVKRHLFPDVFDSDRFRGEDADLFRGVACHTARR